MRLRPGTVRNNAHWENVLGHEPAKSGTQPALPTQPTVQPPAPKFASQVNGLVRPLVRTESIRARRGVKRSYNDKSFEGYDGYDDEDDDFQDAGANSDEDGGGPARKKRKS